MAILQSLISWLHIKRMTQIDLFRKYPVDVQLEMNYKLLKKARETEFGRKYNFESITSIREFQNRVPLSDYENLTSYISRLRKNEQNILWPSEIKWFAKSSGTTNDKSKFIPVSKEALEDCHFKGGKDIIALFSSQRPNYELFKGKTLGLGGSHQINEFSNESYYGDLSAVLIQNLPFWAEFLRTPNLEIALMDEWESKIEKMAHATIKENVTSIAGVPSWTLVLMKRILELTNKKDLSEIWPNLEVFVHGGVSFEPYREQFKKLFTSDKMNYLETYNASEGFFAIQDDLNTRDMLLMLDYGIFYEFIPMEEFGKENPKVLTIGEVEQGKNYALVITTNSGLWRYIIGDTVKFTSLYPHKIVITGRTKHFINAFGEELIIENAEKAIKIASEKTHAEIREYTAAPVYMTECSKGAHEWLFEFSTPPSSIDYFMEILDNALKSVNSDYEAKRYRNMSLDFPKVTVLPDGTFYKWLKDKGKLGGQHKIPRLANHREYIDELLALKNKII
ncbi:MAG: GH3 auxin-responsive promoter family protein [Bacteroidia bacterium]|nr:GH3 auxin-responsive promoter family protein [Bacteroidia bacterium]